MTLELDDSVVLTHIFAKGFGYIVNLLDLWDENIHRELDRKFSTMSGGTAARYLLKISNNIHRIDHQIELDVFAIQVSKMSHRQKGCACSHQSLTCRHA
jgi:hypothetical protein